MSDTLTASFCERCGTRVEFRAPTGLNPVRKTRGFIGGLRNYLVGSEGLSDAMRDAMQVQESVVAAKQLEAFHATIHLCLGCRQYTCNECWNASAGKCRTCAPVPGLDDLADRIAASLDPAAAALAEPAAVPVFEHPIATPLPAESWPTADHEVYAASAALEEEARTFELAVVPPEPDFAIADASAGADAVAEEAEAEPVAATTDDDAWAQPATSAADVDAHAAELDEPEPVAAVERPLLRVVAWDDDMAPAASGVEPDVAAEAEPAVAASAEPAEDERYAALRDLDAEPFLAERTSWIAEVEQEEEWSAQRTAAEREAAEIAATAPDAVVEFEPTPIAAAFGHDPEPYAAVVETEPVEAPQAATAEPATAADEPVAPAAPQPMPRRSGPMRDRITRRIDEPRRPRRQRRVAAEAGADEVAARRAQLEELGLDASAEAADTAPASETPQILPYWSRGAGPSNRDATLAAIRQGSLVWEASAREVDAGGVTVQSCGECGLALSASAKFCRRCGTRQAQPA